MVEGTVDFLKGIEEKHNNSLIATFNIGMRTKVWLITLSLALPLSSHSKDEMARLYLCKNSKNFNTSAILMFNASSFTGSIALIEVEPSDSLWVVPYGAYSNPILDFKIYKDELLIYHDSAITYPYQHDLAYLIDGEGVYQAIAYNFTPGWAVLNFKVKFKEANYVTDPEIVSNLVSIFPNPCIDNLIIYTESTDDFIDFEVRIFDAGGKTVYSYQEKNVASNAKMTHYIDCTQWSVQIYFGELILNRKKTNFKIVKQ
jgi:hypothetical protein